MHWKLVSYTRKVVSPCAYWSQAWMIVNSYSLHHQCHLGNKYLPHAYISSFQPCVGCILAWISFVRCLLSFSEHPFYHLIPCRYFWCYDEILLEVHLYPFKIKLSFVLCFKAKILLVYVWLPLGYHVLHRSIYFVCASFFVDLYLHDWCLLRNLYTWE